MSQPSAKAIHRVSCVLTGEDLHEHLQKSVVQSSTGVGGEGKGHRRAEIWFCIVSQVR